MRTHTHCGRGFDVLASFTGEDRARQAAEYVRTHLHVKVLCDTAGETFIVSDRDMGKPAEAQDSDFGGTGWTSLYAPAHPETAPELQAPGSPAGMPGTRC